MGSVATLPKADAAGQRAARRRADQRETAGLPSDGSQLSPDGSISLAAALGSIMLSLGADRRWAHRSGEKTVAWSTRELAELAGTTVNAIRHYHRVGLLDEPERKYNGYKQYGVRELVGLLRILRLVGLGVPLAKIADVVADGQRTRTMLDEQSADLTLRIERLQQARADIEAILRYDAPTDAPLGFASVASRLSESDTSILHISNQFYDEEAMAHLRRMVELDAKGGEVGKEIDALPADADEMTRERLAASVAPILVQHLVDYPWLMSPVEHISKGARVTRLTFAEALAALYNPAQLGVLARAGYLARKQLQADERTIDEAGRPVGLRQA